MTSDKVKLFLWRRENASSLLAFLVVTSMLQYFCVWRYNYYNTSSTVLHATAIHWFHWLLGVNFIETNTFTYSQKLLPLVGVIWYFMTKIARPFFLSEKLWLRQTSYLSERMQSSGIDNCDKRQRKRIFNALIHPLIVLLFIKKSVMYANFGVPVTIKSSERANMLI